MHRRSLQKKWPAVGFINKAGPPAPWLTAVHRGCCSWTMGFLILPIAPRATPNCPNAPPPNHTSTPCMLTATRLTDNPVRHARTSTHAWRRTGRRAPRCTPACRGRAPTQPTLCLPTRAQIGQPGSLGSRRACLPACSSKPSRAAYPAKERLHAVARELAKGLVCEKFVQLFFVAAAISSHIRCNDMALRHANRPGGEQIRRLQHEPHVPCDSITRKRAPCSDHVRGHQPATGSMLCVQQRHRALAS